jgi:hypothetical protein
MSARPHERRRLHVRLVEAECRRTPSVLYFIGVYAAVALDGAYATGEEQDKGSAR